MKPQKGIALITILVMVALATIIAATIAKHQQSTFENTAYLMRQNQSLYYAKSAEAFFSELLVQDSEGGANIDYLQETWAQPMPAFPVEDGFVSGTLKDESGKFNLNTLLKSDGTENPETKKFFEKLLVRVGLPAELSQAVVDWQDPDDLTVGAMGAESNYYQGLPSPYLAANTQFHQIEELKQVRGFEGAKFDLIAPYISALPEISTKINVNTAQPLLLASLDEKMDVNAVTSAIQAKQNKLEHFSNVNALMTLSPFDSVNTEAKALAPQIFDVKSNYFKAQIEVLLSNRKRQFTSYMMRKDKHVFVYARSLAPF
ncbi:type II secretion system minor pseudopilin GspK [Acinetobacter sp. ANC 4648]|uniref:type II secretion system minor pseudopilin GspK n=1 Tax=Acinetobacter sp. ANC 4648 TaxID=1977875 RepID=UPI000A34210C|nr:type II secretion system minor pseudopilin GspK [Acinetobacter sp. ANC 4648]OTG82996.1 general secretion pathway protein GspK [Acinetobacter sp. ANC 4648]